MPKSSNPSSSTAATAQVSSAGATAATTTAPAQSASEQDAATVAAFLAGSGSPEPVKAEPIKETPSEAQDGGTMTEEQQEQSAETDESQTDEAGEAFTEPPEHAGPEWLEKVRTRIEETGEIPSWFFERAAAPLIKEAEKNAKIRELEAKLAEAQQATEAKPTVVVDTPDNAFAKLTDAELKANEGYFQAQRAWSLRNLTTGGSVGDKDYTPEETADLLLQAEQAIDLIKSAKAESESRREHFEKVAKVAYPELATPGTELRRQVDAIKASKPAYARYPESDTDIADMLAGRKLREERAKGVQTVKITAKTKPATVTTNRTASPIVGAAPRVAISPANAAPDINTLRKQAREGNEKAQNLLAAAFLEPAAS